MKEKTDKLKIDESIAWIQRLSVMRGRFISLNIMASDLIRDDAAAKMKLRILPESLRNGIGLELSICWRRKCTLSNNLPEHINIIERFQ